MPVSKPRGKTAGARQSRGREPVRRKGARGPRATRLPDFVPPSLATLHDDPPRGAEWLHEIKFDGYRIEARLDHGKVRLLTRKRLDWTHRFKPIAAAVAALPAETALLDGELVVENDKGVSSFSLLQTDLKDGRGDRFVYYVFDLLHLDGRDLTGEPLVERKAELQRLLKTAGKNGRIRYAEHFDGRRPGDPQARLRPGSRRHRLEAQRCALSLRPLRQFHQEPNATTPRNSSSPALARRRPMPHAVGALTVAVHDERRAALRRPRRHRLHAQDRARLWQRLEIAARSTSRRSRCRKDERRKDVIWVKPQLVIEAEYRGVTHGNVLRQASYKGLREDKPAREVVREVPAGGDGAAAGGAKVGADDGESTQQSAGKDPACKARGSPYQGKRAQSGRCRQRSPDPSRPRLLARRRRHQERPRRILCLRLGLDGAACRRPAAGAGALLRAAPKANVSSRNISPPTSRIRRCATPSTARSTTSSPWKSSTIWSRWCSPARLEIHVRGSRLERLELCDRIVFDLDPGDGVSWKEIVAAAREVRERLEAVKLESFVKLSGGKGIHVVVPIAGADWDTAKNFTQRIALGMAADSPQLYVAKMTKALRKGRIFIDYFRNSREATSVAPYSTRARPGAAVSAPLSWEELGRTKSAADFTVLNLKKHFRKDPWADIGKVRQKLPQ